MKNQSSSSTSSWPERVFIYTDGASRGNPGPCAYGLQVFSEENKLVYEQGVYLEPNNTNNFAEYQGALQAFKLAKQKKVKHLTLYSDSQLLIRQLEGQYKVKSLVIKPLFLQCQKLLKAIPSYELIHIPREQNTGADALANKALNKMAL